MRQVRALPTDDCLIGRSLPVTALPRYQPSDRPVPIPDTTFGNGGFAATGFSEGVAANGDGWLAVQPDGKILWAGSAPDPNGLTSDFAIARFNPDGTLDSGFGTGGRVTTQFFNPPMAGAQQGAAALLVQPDGKILAVGEGNTPTQNELFLARYLG